jgi:hypothetical protein
MSEGIVLRAPPVELSAEARMNGRIRRLAATSVGGLGAIALLAHATLEAPAAVHAALASGWVLMPVLLALSLGRPVLRYALILPSALVGGALVAVCALALPDGALARTGWLLVTGGVLLGGLLGGWFWYRLLPVPRALDDPFSTARWTLVALHVTAILLGLALVTAAALA